MSQITIALVVVFLVVGLVGVGGTFLQIVRHLRSRTPLPVKRNAALRAGWLLLLSVLMLAILISVSISPDSLVCASLIFAGVVGLTLLVGYFIERQYNRFISDLKAKGSK